MVKAIRDHLAGRRPSTTAVPAGDKELIEQHLERVVVKQRAIELYLIDEAEHTGYEKNQGPATREPVNGAAACSLFNEGLVSAEDRASHSRWLRTARRTSGK